MLIKAFDSNPQKNFKGCKGVFSPKFLRTACLISMHWNLRAAFRLNTWSILVNVVCAWKKCVQYSTVLGCAVMCVHTQHACTLEVKVSSLSTGLFKSSISLLNEIGHYLKRKTTLNDGLNICTFLKIWIAASQIHTAAIAFPCSQSFKLLFNFLTVVQVQLSTFSPNHSPPPHWSLPPTLDPTPFSFVHVSFIHVPWRPFPYFPPLSLSPLPSGYCQFVLYFKVSGCILLACLFCWLGSTYGWDQMVFVFHHLAYFTYIMLSRSIHAAAKGRNFFLSAA